MRQGRLSAALVLLALLLAAGHAAAQSSQRVAAQALFDQGRNLMNEQRYAEACSKFEESQRLDPAIGTQFNLALCYERQGRVASAWALYLEVAGDTKKRGEIDREKVARERAGQLEPKLSRLVVKVPEASRTTGLKIDRGGEDVGAALWGMPTPVDPGKHVITANAPGKKPWSTEIDVPPDAATAEVEVPPLEDAPPGTESAEAGGTAPGAGPAGPAVADRGVQQPTKDELSHEGKLGGLLRADIDGQFRGAVVAVGVSYGVASAVDVMLVGLIGRDKGLEPSSNIYVMQGLAKPFVTLGVPVFFIDGARVGLRGGAGIQLDVAPSVGFMASLSAVYFPSLPDSYDNFVLVPSLGVQARL
jgi:hypothetical protein